MLKCIISLKTFSLLFSGSDKLNIYGNDDHERSTEIVNFMTSKIDKTNISDEKNRKNSTFYLYESFLPKSNNENILVSE